MLLRMAPWLPLKTKQRCFLVNKEENCYYGSQTVQTREAREEHNPVQVLLQDRGAALINPVEQRFKSPRLHPYHTFKALLAMASPKVS